MNNESLIKEAIETFRELNRFIRRQQFPFWMELNMTMPQIRTLFYIANHPRTNLKKLAERLSVTSSNTTVIVDKLVEQGFLTREDDPEDRRKLVLKTTEQGEDVINNIRGRRSDFLHKAFSGMSREELEIFVKGISLLNKSIKRLESDDENDRST